MSSCDGAAHLVTRHCYRTMLTQSIGILTSNTTQNNNRNLAKSRDLLSTMISNGNENIETLDEVFKDYFDEKCSSRLLQKTFGLRNAVQFELHNVKFACMMCGRMWNRNYYPFLGCYFQRGDSFEENHTFQLMNDAEYTMCYENAKAEWEEELRNNPDCNIEDPEDWCA